jgi:hypothetical protein
VSHVVYRAYGDDASLLYVGMTGRGMARFQQHAHRANVSGSMSADDSNLPNPWVHVAPSCPPCGSSERVYLWANEDKLRWYCAGCRKRFDAAEEVAA